MKKKNWKLMAFLAVVLTATLCVCGALAAEYGVIYRTETLNLRAQASSSSQWLGSYQRGTWVRISGSQNNFYYVHGPDGRSGYMSKNYIQTVGNNDHAWIVRVTNANGGAFLNLRAQPSYSAQVLDILFSGVPLYVHSYNNGWYCVEINGQIGYVRSEYVADLGVYAQGSPNVATIKTPNSGLMNMRSGPGTGYEVIQQFPGDTYVSVLAKGKDWWYVSANGINGFMSDDYLVDGLQAARDLNANKSTISSAQPYAVVSNPLSTQALNLRQYASTGSQVLDKLYNGRKLWINEQGTEWCAVTDQVTGLSGYVMTRYITLHNALLSPLSTTETVISPTLRSPPLLTALLSVLRPIPPSQLPRALGMISRSYTTTHPEWLQLRSPIAITQEIHTPLRMHTFPTRSLRTSEWALTVQTTVPHVAVS